MACEGRIVRVLRALGYPELEDIISGAEISLEKRPHELARVVSWIEDRKLGAIKTSSAECEHSRRGYSNAIAESG